MLDLIYKGNKGGEKDKRCWTYVRVRVRAGMTLTVVAKEIRSVRSKEA